MAAFDAATDRRGALLHVAAHPPDPGGNGGGCAGGVRPAIYGGSPRELIEAITIVDDDVRTLLLVGHVPGIPWTAWELADNRSSPQAEQIQEKFPTSALAVLEFDRPWAEVAPGTGELICFHVPR